MKKNQGKATFAKPLKKTKIAQKKKGIKLIKPLSKKVILFYTYHIKSQ
jgi:hypothetical protein